MITDLTISDVKQTSARKITQDLISAVSGFISGTPWRTIYSSRLNYLYEKADMKCELAVVGRVKAGKSSFLNALLEDDLAMVGTTETTATVNFFKYGKPKESRYPVKVIWADGKEEWQTKSFLDSLQGNTMEILKRAEGIDHLEYYVDNEKLQDITLVDTPGTGSLVNLHEERVNAYINPVRENLCKKNDERSNRLKDRADAVIVITERVPENETSQLVNLLSGENTSSFNAIGVMTKIDYEDVTTKEDWNRRCQKYSDLLRQNLSVIIPVSAGVYREVKKLEKQNRLEFIQNILKRIPNEDNLFFELVSDSNVFLSEDPNVSILFDKYGISFQERHDVVGDMPYMVFYTIARELYCHPINEAINYLIEYSGMKKLNELLDMHFFSRAQEIKCFKIVNEVYQILCDIRDRRIGEQLQHSKNLNDYLAIIQSSTTTLKGVDLESIKVSFEQFVTNNICSMEHCKLYEKKTEELLNKAEEILKNFENTNKKSDALYRLERKQSSFPGSLYEELEILFGKYPDRKPPKEASYIIKRQNFWNSRRMQVADLEVKQIIEIAIHEYGILNRE